MRLFGFEISKAPKKISGVVWTRAARAPIGLLVDLMSPDELREELKWAATELQKGNTLYIGPRDPFKRVQVIKNYNQD